MYRYLIIIFLITSCQNKINHFEYETAHNVSGILIKNYTPIPQKEFNNILLSIHDSLRMDSINVFLTAENINKINPRFKKTYFTDHAGKEELNSNKNDTLRTMKNLRIWIGTFKGTSFVKEDEIDQLYLNNKFFTSPQ